MVSVSVKLAWPFDRRAATKTKRGTCSARPVLRRGHMAGIAGALALLVSSLACAANGPAESAVLVYDASFFTEARPYTALDMINRLPGFQLDIGLNDTGQMARGFADSAGNVLVGGRRPTSKADTLDLLLARIPAK